jgi:phosphate transport system permease protein
VSLTQGAPGPGRVDLTTPRSGADTAFRVILAICASTTLFIIASIIISLLLQIGPAVHSQGLKLLGPNWIRPLGPFGIMGDLVGSVIIAAIALLFAFPLSVGTALAINEYVPRWSRQTLTGLVELLAAIPSLIFGLWGVFFLNNHVFKTSAWLGHHADFFPLFRLIPNSPPNGSLFLAGMVVAIMILPLMTAVIREVMSQVPRDGCEAALALGGTRWGMITDVILPFSRSGIIGAAMLGLGRALGETIAVSLILNANDQLTSHILQPGGGSISALIVRDFTSSGRVAQSAQVFAGLILFAVTLGVNILARVIASKGSR